MKKSWYTEEQPFGILKQHEAGVKTADLSSQLSGSLPVIPHTRCQLGSHLGQRVHNIPQRALISGGKQN
jgi:hypothetical protein